MLVAFSSRAKPGKEKEFEQLLNNPEASRAQAKAMGATRMILFLSKGRMIRVLEFPEGITPPSMEKLAQRHADVKNFLRRLGPLLEGGFEIDTPGSLEAFSQSIRFDLAFDIKV